jgi:uncharacterized protein (UPF0332 family)
LFAVARLLAAADAVTQPSDAQLRRPVSTAYYALFHKVSRAAALRFMGPDHENTAGYAIIYRGFEHRHMKMVCEALRASTLKEKFRRHLCRNAVSADMRDFADAFPKLQEARHLADYDPAVAFPHQEVLSLIDSADAAITAFERADPVEQADILALMMVRTRD